MIVNDSTKLFVKDCQKIEMKILLQEVKKALKIELLKSHIAINGLDTSISSSQTGNGGNRYWFDCPLCKERCGILYQHRLNCKIACRKCLNLEYSKR